MKQPDLKVTVTLGEITEYWRKLRRGERTPLSGASLHGGDSWAGCTLAQMDSYLANGYSGGEPLSMPDRAATMNVPELLFDEDEGDLVYSLAVAGDDLYRIRWEDQSVPRGIAIRLRQYSSASVNSEVVNALAEWLLKVVDGVERQGESPDVLLYAPVRLNDGRELDVEIPVRTAGKQTDIAAWRAILAPGGYRHLVFLAIRIGAYKVGGVANSGLGSNRMRTDGRNMREWQLDVADDILTIDPPAGYSSVPTEMLTTKVAELLN